MGTSTPECESGHASPSERPIGDDRAVDPCTPERADERPDTLTDESTWTAPLRSRPRYCHLPPACGWASGDLPVTLSLLPESVIEERPPWTLAVNRNQDLLGRTMVVLRRHCTTVIDIAPHEWVLLRDELRRLVPALDRLFHPDQFNFAFLMTTRSARSLPDAHASLPPAGSSREAQSFDRLTGELCDEFDVLVEVKHGQLRELPCRPRYQQNPGSKEAVLPSFGEHGLNLDGSIFDPRREVLDRHRRDRSFAEQARDDPLRSEPRTPPPTG